MLATFRTILLWILAAASAAAFRPRGTAPYSNTTSLTTPQAVAPSSSLSPADYSSTPQPPYPIFSSGGVTSNQGPSSSLPLLPRPSATRNTTNITKADASCTVNIPSANLEWWYIATFDHVVGTLTESARNFTNMPGYLTMVPNTETFDVSSAISNDIAYTESVSYDSEWDMYWTLFEPYTVTPTAAVTSVITRNAAMPLPSGNIIPSSDLALYESPVDGLPPASVPIATVANSTAALTSATPFLYFTVYEVVAPVSGTISTRTVTLPQPSAIEYEVKGIESSESATGTVPDEFLQRIPEASCSPGTVYGTVTVLVVVDLFYMHISHPVPFLVRIESTALGFESESDVVVVAQDTSTGQPFTMSSEGETTRGGGAKTTSEDKPSAEQTSIGGHNAGSNLANILQPTQETVGSIGTNPVVVGPSVVLVGTATLTPGGPATTIDGSSISLAPSATAIVVGGQASALPIIANPASPSQTVGTVGGSPVVVEPSSVVVIGGQTLQPGGPPVTIGGNAVSLATSASAIIVGTKTSALPQVLFPGDLAQTQAPAPPVITIGSLTLTANAATQFFISSGQTLTPSGTATVDGTVVSLGPSAAFIVIGGSTQILPAAQPGVTARPEIIIGGTVITALPGNPNGQDSPNSGQSGPTFVVSGQTLAPGHAITVDGTTISLPQSGSVIVVNGVTSTLATAPPAAITPPPLTIGNGVFSPLPGTGTSYMIGSAILTPGGVITVAGTTISLAPGATALVVNGVTTTLQPEPMITNPPILTIGSHTYTAVSGTGTTFIISGKTLTPGGTITVDGTTISLAPGATELIYGSSGRTTSTALFPATTTRGQSVTSSVSASAGAGATGTNGAATATSRTKGAGCSVQIPGVEGWIVALIMGFLNLWG